MIRTEFEYQRLVAALREAEAERDAYKEMFEKMALHRMTQVTLAPIIEDRSYLRKKLIYSLSVESDIDLNASND